MDRQAVIGFVLIFIVLMIWMTMNAPPPAPTSSEERAAPVALDTPQTIERDLAAGSAGALGRIPAQEEPSYGSFFQDRAEGKETIIIVETDLFVAEISSRGGVVRKWELKNYKTWNGHPVQLVDLEEGGDLSALFGTSDGKLVNTHDLYFETERRMWDRITLTGDEEQQVRMWLPASNGGKLVRTYTFRNGTYGFDLDIELQGMSGVISNFEYQLVWEHGLHYAEQNSVDESHAAAAFAFAGNELTEIDASTVGEPVRKDMSGNVDWVATRTKYFGVSMMAHAGESEGAYLEGTRRAVRNEGVKEDYAIALKVPFKGEQIQRNSFTVFLGPLDIDVLKSYDRNLDQVLSLGWSWLIRPIAVWVMIPLFQLIHVVVPNWGLVIIVFSVIIKVVLHPLTRTSMKSMKKMQALQPMMEEIRTKYKDDPQKMNSQIMNLYKEYGVNPAGGCLPLLLQFPILIALYNVFRGAIELRQSEFFWWIQDLSIPDTIFTLPFKLPLFGIQDVSGLALLMGITTFVQQKMTVKDPRQKTMVYIMPIMLTLLFNSFPSGLNLYYFVFNLLSIGQQMLITRQHGEEPLRKVEPKKRYRGGLFGKYTKNMPRLKK
jgi:YidC/Oxa1 family membrane protein insertase